MNWRTVIGFPNYQISDTGLLKNTVRILNPSKTTKGYLRTTLVSNGYKKQFSIHRLVAIHFIPNTNNLPELNHIDGDKTNNKKSNLEWCTARHNQLHAYRTGLKIQYRGSSHGRAKLDEKTVIKIRGQYKNGNTLEGLAAKYGVCKSSIGYIVNNQTWTHV